MTIHDIYEAMEKIGALSFTTLDGENMYSRIVHVTGCEDDGLYFLTMEVKPFYRQLKSNPKLSICGIYPVSYPDGKNAVGQPCYAPGFTFRLSGEVREVPQEEMESRAAGGSQLFKYVLEDQERYPNIRLFCIHKGKGEIFDFDFEMEKRDHKVLRTRFAFGGETCNGAGLKITEDCIACGECEEACTFKAIVPGGPYRIDGSRCDECGSCYLVCPQDAIVLSDFL